MKKPSLKRRKQPGPQQQTVQAPAPAPAAKRGRLRGLKRKKQPSPQQQAAVRAPAPAPAAKRGRLRGPKRKKQLTPQQQAAAQAPAAAPAAKRGRLRGRAGIIVFGVLAVIVVIAVLQLRGGRDDEKLVRDALATYEQASRDKDYQTLCDELLAKSYVRQTASSGLPCEVALRTGLEDVRSPTLDVLGVEVNGDRAAARVRGSAAGQVPAEATYTLVREDDAWRILPPRGDTSTP
ncbi:MAG: nuclear transport factor 2 family protein [Solirubrobacteraceae bacterium]